jgi:hypothetical protein
LCPPSVSSDRPLI